MGAKVWKGGLLFGIEDGDVGKVTVVDGAAAAAAGHLDGKGAGEQVVGHAEDGDIDRCPGRAIVECSQFIERTGDDRGGGVAEYHFLVGWQREGAVDAGEGEGEVYGVNVV